MSDDNVIKFEKPKPDSEEEAAADNFEEIQRKNRENQERLKKERAKNNKSVTRSHRLKKDK